jgi:superfamily II DNA/RNA helicase
VSILVIQFMQIIIVVLRHYSFTYKLTKICCIYVLCTSGILILMQAIIFCRTKLDCDNVEKYLISLDGGKTFMCNKSVIAIAYSCTSELNCTILPGF